MALVYKAVNKNNGKSYIGCTRTSLARRAYMHVWAATATTQQDKIFYFGRAIRKHGAGAFVFSVVRDGLTWDEALDLERELIAKHRPEYNVAAGGRGSSGVKWTERRHKQMAASLRAAWTDARRAKQEATYFKKRGGPKKVFVRTSFPKSVVCLNSGAWFQTVRAASSELGISRGLIQESCAKGTKAAGVYFCYSEKPMGHHERIQKLTSAEDATRIRIAKWRSCRVRPVVCVTSGETHASGAAAARAYNLAPMTIVQCCRDGVVTKSGLKFRYADANGPIRDKHTKSHVDVAKAEASKRAGLEKTWAKSKRKVVCLDDGRVFESITEAAAAYEKHVSLVSAAIHRKGKSAGRRFQFVGA
jgi:hypothetical protein